MKKEYIYGLGIAALIFYLLWKEEKDKNQKKGAIGGAQPQPTYFWSVPFGYGSGGDVNQNVNVYQTQGATSPATQSVVTSPAPMGGKGGGKGR
jgi:hypothetical protein